MCWRSEGSRLLARERCPLVFHADSITMNDLRARCEIPKQKAIDAKESFRFHFPVPGLTFRVNGTARYEQKALCMTTKDLIEIISSFLAGATISAALTFQITKTKFSRINKTRQTGNVAGGDIVGGDKH